MIFIFKKGDPNQPSNFRPIALTICVGKLFNKILAYRLEASLVNNKIIDVSSQRGILSGTNGVMELILRLNAMLQNAKDQRLPLSKNFVDLKNAFGSISHKLLSDMLSRVKIPTEISSYINDMNSKLNLF